MVASAFNITRSFPASTPGYNGVRKADGVGSDFARAIETQLREMQSNQQSVNSNLPGVLLKPDPAIDPNVVEPDGGVTSPDADPVISGLPVEPQPVISGLPVEPQPVISDLPVEPEPIISGLPVEPGPAAFGIRVEPGYWAEGPLPTRPSQPPVLMQLPEHNNVQALLNMRLAARMVDLFATAPTADR